MFGVKATTAAVLMALTLMIAPAALAQDGGYVQPAADGQVDWENGLVTAVGIGAPPANAVNMAQARAMALRAAEVVARRNLLEIIKGVQIDSVTTVENFMVSSDVVQTRVRGFLRNSQVIKRTYLSDGSVEVTVGVNLHGAFSQIVMPQTVPFKATTPAPQAPSAPAVQPQLPATQPEPAKPEPVKVHFTGLLLDARGLGVRPAMSPKVVDENGNEVYGSLLVSREYAIQQGMAGYAKNPDKASANPRIAAEPLIVKADKATGKAYTDLVVSNAVAEQIRSLSSGSKVLEQCKVMIVLD